MSNNSARARVGRGAAASHPAAGGPGKGRGTGRHVASCGPGAGRGPPSVPRPACPRPPRPQPAPPEPTPRQASAYCPPAKPRPLRPCPAPHSASTAHSARAPCRTASIAQHPRSVSVAPLPRVKPHSLPASRAPPALLGGHLPAARRDFTG